MVASVTDFSVYVVFIAVNLTVILLRFWQPNRRPTIPREWLDRQVPVARLAALATIGLLIPSLELDRDGVGAAVMLVGIATYAVLARLRPTTPTRDPPNEPMTPEPRSTATKPLGWLTALRIDFAPSTSTSTSSIRA